MRKQLSYLFGAAFLLCSISTFTSCGSDNDDNNDLKEIPDEGNGGDKGNEWIVSGEYSEENSEKALKMTYNGEELTGKKISITFDEANSTAAITLEGTEKDLGTSFGGLLDIKVRTYSPIPGEKEVKLENVKLNKNEDGSVYSFEATDTKATRTVVYKGIIKEKGMEIEINQTLANETLNGTWNLANAKKVDLNGGAPTPQSSAPLWLDWNTNQKINVGTLHIPMNGQIIELALGNRTPAFIFALINSDMVIQTTQFDMEQTVANLLKSITFQKNGCIYAQYSYSGDLNNPLWSDQMNRNTLRYYYGETAGKIYIEVNPDYIANAISGLLSSTTRAGNMEDMMKAIQALINVIKPTLEKGIPCDYEIIGNNKMAINIDGIFLRNVLQKLSSVANDPYTNELLMGLLQNDATFSTYAENVKNILESLPAALSDTNCQYVKIGFYLEKAE